MGNIMCFMIQGQFCLDQTKNFSASSHCWERKYIKLLIFCFINTFSQDKERKDRERLAKRQEQDDNSTEIANCIYGDILTENPAVAQSAFGPHRVIPDRWKGMTSEQRTNIQKKQEEQRLENEVSKNTQFYIVIF